MADTFTDRGQLLGNLLLDTAECGIGLTGGTHTADGNRVYNRNPVVGGGNTAIYVAHYGKSTSCGPMTITNNIADELRADGRHSGWWNRGDCGTIDISTDTCGVPANPLLTPAAVEFPAPLIPPQPKTCAVTSPYSTQTAATPCSP